MYDLVGVDGNAFNILGYVQTAMQREGYSKSDISKYINNATKGDYNNLLAESVSQVNKINKKVSTRKKNRK